jgi:hypothetical protein
LNKCLQISKKKKKKKCKTKIFDIVEQMFWKKNIGNSKFGKIWKNEIFYKKSFWTGLA